MGKQSNRNKLQDYIDYFKDVHQRKYDGSVGSAFDRKEYHGQEKLQHDPFVKIVCSGTFVVIGVMFGFDFICDSSDRLPFVLFGLMILGGLIFLWGGVKEYRKRGKRRKF